MTKLIINGITVIRDFKYGIYYSSRDDFERKTNKSGSKEKLIDNRESKMLSEANLIISSNFVAINWRNKVSFKSELETSIEEAG